MQRGSLVVSSNFASFGIVAPISVASQTLLSNLRQVLDGLGAAAERRAFEAIGLNRT